MQRAAGAAAVGQPGAARLASAARRRRGQQRHLAARVVARYAAGAGPVPPSAAAAPPLPPAQQQAAAQRPPVAPRRRVGVNVPPPTPVAPPGSSTLQSLSAAGFGTGGAAFSPVAAQEQQQQPFTVNVRQAAALASTGEVVLSRSQIMNKEVITRQATCCKPVACAWAWAVQETGADALVARLPWARVLGCPLAHLFPTCPACTMQDQRPPPGLCAADVCGPRHPVSRVPLPAQSRQLDWRQKRRG